MTLSSCFISLRQGARRRKKADNVREPFLKKGFPPGRLFPNALVYIAFFITVHQWTREGAPSRRIKKQRRTGMGCGTWRRATFPAGGAYPRQGCGNSRKARPAREWGHRGRGGRIGGRENRARPGRAAEARRTIRVSGGRKPGGQGGAEAEGAAMRDPPPRFWGRSPGRGKGRGRQGRGGECRSRPYPCEA